MGSLNALETCLFRTYEVALGILEVVKAMHVVAPEELVPILNSLFIFQESGDVRRVLEK